MRAHFRIAILCAALLPLLPPAGIGAADQEPVTIGIVRQDGIIVPFASWTGKAWENSWPVPEKEAEIPISVAEIPRRWWSKATGPLDRWFVWQVDGSTTSVQVTAPTWFPAHCQQGTGLRTSLAVRQPVPPPRIQPYPKIGLALSRRLDLTPIETLDPGGPLGTALLKVLPGLMSDDEDRDALRYRTTSNWKHPYDDAARRRVPITIEALYRAPARRAGVFMHYFEAVKRYPPIGTPPAAESKTRPPKPPPCEVATAMAGWIIARDGETSVKPSAWATSMTSCDFNTVDVMLPLATVVVDRTLWIAQLSGWGRERYALIDPSAPELESVIWAAPGGTCRKPSGAQE